MKTSAEWRLLAAFWRASRPLTFAWWAFIVVRGVLPALFAVATGFLVASVEQGDPLTVSLAAMGAVFIAMNTLAPIHGTVGAILGARTGVWLNNNLLRACVDPPGLAHLERPDLADELSRARDFDQGVTAPSLATALPEVGSGFTTIAGGLSQAIVLATYRWWAPVVVGGGWLLTHVLLRESALWKIWSADEFTKVKRHADYAYRLAVESQGAKEMRLFGLADWAVQRFAKLRTELTQTLYEARRLRQRPLRWSVIAVVAGNVTVFWSLAASASNGALPLEQLSVYALVTVGTSALAFSEFDWWFRGSAVPVPKVLDLAEAMRPAGTLVRGTKSAGGSPSSMIRFEGVGFAYPTTGRRVLDGFELEIPAGSSLAIVGPNGAGKTTLAKLLCRLYDPDEGRITVDGTDLREIDVEAWRAQVAAVFQDFIRLELSLRENVAPIDPDDVGVRMALEQARAADLAELDRVLSRMYEGGTDLSGGQWQRVALARALYKVGRAAGVVLLDEPTAQLDVRGEAEIFDRLIEATRGRTTILISHRFSTVRHADRICVLDGGKVIEVGSHDALMDLGGRYRTLFDLQASRFYEEEESDAPVAHA